MTGWLNFYGKPIDVFWDKKTTIVRSMLKLVRHQEAPHRTAYRQKVVNNTVFNT